WETFHRRPMLEALARQALGQAIILCINPPVSLRQAISSRWVGRRESLLPLGGPKRLAQNLYVGTPALLMPGTGRQFQRKYSIGWKMVSGQVTNVLNKIGNKDSKVISWVYRPEQLHCLELASEENVIFECYDEYSLSPIDGVSIPGMKDREDELLSKADLIFTTSKALFESRSERYPVVIYAPNGVDFDLFSRVVKDKAQIPKDLRRVPTPRIGYMGNISGRVDFDLLESVVKLGEKYSFVFLGPVEKSSNHEVEKLARHPNVFFLGRKS
ncbi:unnamed protein product, partial [marine sediment metagenome]